MSLKNEKLLYQLFGVNAELLIDHAWGWESCTMADIKAYRPQNNSLSSGQVLPEPYSYEKGRLIVKEMADCLALDLVEKGLVTNAVVLAIGYDTKIPDNYKGNLSRDWYGRTAPKGLNTSARLMDYTSAATVIRRAVLGIYDTQVDKELFVRHVGIAACNVIPEGQKKQSTVVQPDLFTDIKETEALNDELLKKSEKEKRQMLAAISIKKKFGKNAIVRLMDLEEGAKTIDRNNQIGGHKA
jgi:DNA polymerase V